jgi:hypothetical protein
LGILSVALAGIFLGVLSTIRSRLWYVGDGFGIENSVLTIVLILGFSIYLFLKARQQDRIFKPFWKR